jgi:succinyl-CoA synthetase alpha subunit
MSILLSPSSRVLVQGITGREGAFHTRQMLAYGTTVVAGVTPGKGGERVDRVPVYDTVVDAVAHTGADVSVVFVPAARACDAVLEAAEAGIRLIVCITEGIPTWDAMLLARQAQALGAILLGPNCPGIIVPGMAKVGIMPGHIHRPGPVGVVSRSGTLTYEVVWALTQAGLGQSTCLGIGGDPIQGLDFVDILRRFEADAATRAIALIGEIGGDAEERAAEYVAREISKPVVALVAGRTAPVERRMGHAGAVISAGSGRAVTKIDVLRQAGAGIAEHPAQVADLLAEALT